MLFNSHFGGPFAVFVPVCLDTVFHMWSFPVNWIQYFICGLKVPNERNFLSLIALLFADTA